MKIKNAQFILSIVGAILILANGVWIAIEGKAIIISSFPATSMDELSGNWGRITFGMPSLIFDPAIFVWLFLAVVNLLLVIMLHFRPKKQYSYGFSTLILSLLSIPIGGGFFIGMILTIIRSMSAIENKPFKETFLGKIFRVARLDSTVYENNPVDLRLAVLAIAFLNILTGLGNSLYLLNANKILKVDPIFPETGPNILLKGAMIFDISLLSITATYIGIAIVKWFILSVIIYFAVTKIAGGNAKFETMAHCIAFAYAPTAIQLFMPLIIFNEPLLTGGWPLTFFFVSNLWMGIALISAVKKISGFNLGRALGTTVLGGAIYYLINYGFIESVFVMQGIRFIIKPIEVMELFLSIAVVLALLLGVFSTHEHG